MDPLETQHIRAAQAPLLAALEPRLVHLWRIRLPWWLAQPLSRFASRCSSLNSLRSAVLYLALSTVAGSISMQCIALLRSHSGELQRHLQGVVTPVRGVDMPVPVAPLQELKHGSGHTAPCWAVSMGLAC